MVQNIFCKSVACFSTQFCTVFVHVLQVFEWWYFRKYGTSFIEQVSVNHIGPLLGGGGNDEADSNNASSNENKQSIEKSSCIGLLKLVFIVRYSKLKFNFC